MFVSIFVSFHCCYYWILCDVKLAPLCTLHPTKQTIVGVLGFISRLLKQLFFGTMFISRLDRPLLPASFAEMDKGFLAYVGLCYFDNYYGEHKFCVMLCIVLYCVGLCCVVRMCKFTITCVCVCVCVCSKTYHAYNFTTGNQVLIFFCHLLLESVPPRQVAAPDLAIIKKSDATELRHSVYSDKQGIEARLLDHPYHAYDLQSPVAAAAAADSNDGGAYVNDDDAAAAGGDRRHGNGNLQTEQDSEIDILKLLGRRRTDASLLLKAKRARTRFKLAVTLLNNPGLKKLRKRYLQDVAAAAAAAAATANDSKKSDEGDADSKYTNNSSSSGGDGSGGGGGGGGDYLVRFRRTRTNTLRRHSSSATKTQTGPQQFLLDSKAQDDTDA